MCVTSYYTIYARIVNVTLQSNTGGGEGLETRPERGRRGGERESDCTV